MGKKRAQTALLLLTSLLAVLVPFYYAFLDPDWHHDGIMFKPAADVAAGLTLFRDTFFQYGALTAYLHAFAIKIFGAYLLVIRLEAALFLVGIALLIFFLARKIANTSVAALIVLVWLSVSPYFGGALLPWSSIYAVFFVLLAGALLISAFDPQKTPPAAYWLSLAAGIAISAAFWSRQPVGVLLPFGFLIFLILLLDRNYSRGRIIRSAAFYCLGFLLLTAVFLGYLQIAGALGDWWTQSIVGASSFATDMKNVEQSFLADVLNHLLPWSPRSNRIKGLGGGFIWSLLPLLCVGVFASLLGALLFRRKLSASNRSLLIVTVLAIGMWHQYFPVSSSWQIYWGATLMLVPVITAIFTIASFMTKKSIGVALIGLILVGLLFGQESNRRVRLGLTMMHYAPLSVPTLEGMWASKLMASKNRFSGTPLEYGLELHHLGEVLSNVRVLDPQKPLTTLGADLFLPATLAAKNPGPMTAGWYWLSLLYPNHAERLKQFIREEQPLIEIKLKPDIPYHYLNWESQHPDHVQMRKEFGLADYAELIRSEYSDSGTSIIIAPSSFIARYNQEFRQND